MSRLEQVQRERIRTLDKITNRTEKHCKGCEKFDYLTREPCKGCAIYAQLTQLGDDLDAQMKEMRRIRETRKQA